MSMTVKKKKKQKPHRKCSFNKPGSPKKKSMPIFMTCAEPLCSSQDR